MKTYRCIFLMQFFLWLAGCGSSSEDNSMVIPETVITPEPKPETHYFDLTLYSDENISISRNLITGATTALVNGHRVEVKNQLLLDFEVFDESNVVLFLFYLDIPGDAGVISLRKIDMISGKSLLFDLETINGMGNDYYIDYNEGSDTAIVCQQDHCESVAESTAAKIFRVAPNGAEISALHYGENDLKFIFRSKGGEGFDFRGRTVTRSGEIISEVDFNDDSCVSIIKATGEFDCIENQEFLENMYTHEFLRRRNYGSLDLGVNNILGRVVWSQASYLSAMNDLLMFAKDGTSINYRDEIYGSFIAQINSICNLLAAEDGPFLNSTRYSVNGEEILFLLHISIVYLALIEVDTSLLVNEPELLAKLEKSTDLLRDIVLEPNAQGGQTVPLESLDYFDFNEGKFLTLIFKKGFPFWADGANSPHNFVSSYISARIHAESGVTNTSHQLLEGLVSLTQLNVRQDWGYWSGLGETGWAADDDISVNTPSYSGGWSNDSAASVGYRTNDARAILIACSYDMSGYYAESSCDQLVQHIGNLVRTGILLPVLNRYLCQIATCAVIENQKYRNSSYLSDVEQQFWYLYGLSTANTRTLGNY